MRSRAASQFSIPRAFSSFCRKLAPQFTALKLAANSDRFVLREHHRKGELLVGIRTVLQRACASVLRLGCTRHLVALEPELKSERNLDTFYFKRCVPVARNRVRLVHLRVGWASGK
jgi:hypothetical protein